ncbi:MAG: MOSC domain-containing protein [Isosphaeraceae bacterium]|nr:MOSC domain-containing protein [Isosphaeraceae bacterium]
MDGPSQTPAGAARVVSLQVGLPREVEYRGRIVTTGIFKEPVDRPLELRRFNLEGDGQADLSVHGGPDKAVYAYPYEHYPAWSEFVGRELAPGAFGENLTTEGLIETSVHIGDRFQVGTAVLVVTQPRMPCFKLGLRFGDPSIVRAFLEAGRPGIYFGIVEEGIVAPGDPIERLEIDPQRISVSTMNLAMNDRDAPRETLEALLRIPALAQTWREEFEERLGRVDG